MLHGLYSFASLFEMYFKNMITAALSFQTDDLQGHIIICGFGRVGQVGQYVKLLI